MYVDYKELGKRIAARRKALGLKQYQVNEMAELSDKYLSNIETARSIPSIDVLMKICDALECFKCSISFHLSFIWVKEARSLAQGHTTSE